MSNYPRNARDRLIWCQDHWALWEEHYASLGVTEATVLAFKNLITNSDATYAAATAARLAAKNATQDQNAAFAAMDTSARSLISTIKSFIEASNDPSLWALAGLTPPATPGTAPAPTAPFSITGTLNSMGDLILKWKARQPAGTSNVVYAVRRALDGGEFVTLDTVGGKEFVDETVPVGTRTVTYAIQAKRGRQRSEWSEAVTLRFGRGGTSLTVVSTPAKLAA